VVISESLAKGVPVVSSNVGGIPEMVSEECGILVPPGDESRLTEALNTMLDHCHEYDRGTIRQYGAQYSFAEVGAQFKHVYEQIPTL